MEKEKEKKHVGIKIFAIFIILIVLLLLYGRYLNPHELKVKEVPVYNKSLPSDYNGFKIAQFSDLHYGRTINEEELKKVIQELNALNADIIIFTGDLFDNKNIAQENQKLITKYLKELKAKLYKFAIIGDYDQKYLKTYQTILEDSEFTLLDNQNMLVYYESKTPLNFIGLTSPKNIKDLYANETFNITLTHEPDNVKKITNSPLVFAGHSLGGQIKIPFIGGLRKIKGAETYYENTYTLKDTTLYISNGLGTQDFSFRLFNAPSITLYRLYQK